jgi:hypothetical protein
MHMRRLRRTRLQYGHPTRRNDAATNDDDNTAALHATTSNNTTAHTAAPRYAHPLQTRLGG